MKQVKIIFKEFSEKIPKVGDEVIIVRGKTVTFCEYQIDDETGLPYWYADGVCSDCLDTDLWCYETEMIPN